MSCRSTCHFTNCACLVSGKAEKLTKGQTAHAWIERECDEAKTLVSVLAAQWLMLLLTPLPSAIHAATNNNSLSSHQLSMLAASHSPPIGYQCWPSMLPLTPLPLAINDGHTCYLSLPFHRLSMLTTNAPIGYQ